MSAYQLKHHRTGAVLFKCELDAEPLGAPDSRRRGAAIKLAVRAYANIAGADLSGADLNGARLISAYLNGADLRNAGLRGADLRNAKLRGADMRDACLRGADMRGADLTGANIAGVADLIGAGAPNGWHAFGWHRDGVRVRVGCHDLTLEEGRAYWADKPDRAEVRAALDYIEAVARLRGWSATAAAECMA